MKLSFKLIAIIILIALSTARKLRSRRNVIGKLTKICIFINGEEKCKKDNFPKIENCLKKQNQGGPGNPTSEDCIIPITEKTEHMLDGSEKEFVIVNIESIGDAPATSTFFYGNACAITCNHIYIETNDEKCKKHLYRFTFESLPDGVKNLTLKKSCSEQLKTLKN